MPESDLTNSNLPHVPSPEEIANAVKASGQTSAPVAVPPAVPEITEVAIPTPEPTRYIPPITTAASVAGEKLGELGDALNFANPNIPVAVDLSGSKIAKINTPSSTENPGDSAKVKAAGGLSPLRTFRGDMANAIQAENLSLAQMVIKEDEKKRGETKEAVVQSRTRTVAFAVSGVLVLAGILILGYVFLFRGGEEDTGPQMAIPAPIVFSDAQTILDTTGLTPDQTKNRFKLLLDENLRIGAVRHVAVTETRAFGEANLIAPVPLETFFALFELSPPERLPRLLLPDYTLGIHSFKENTAFLILKTNAFQGAFAEMLTWEKTLGRQIYPILSGKDFGVEEEKAKWADEVISNVDLRILAVGTSTPPLLVYTFLGSRDTLLIARDLDTIEEIKARLESNAQFSQ